MSTPGPGVAERLFQVLFAFSPERRRLTLADITRRTGLPHATARRLVHSLLAAGALEREEDGSFVIGLKVWQMGTLAPRSMTLRTAALPYMEDLHAALRQHVQLGILEGHEAVLVERFSAPTALNVVSRVGGRLPLHSSGIGKVLLSRGGPQLFQEIVDRGLKAYTPNTITDPEVLRRDLADVRSRGFSVVREETSRGADSVAVPVFGAGRQVVAALSVVVASGTVNLNSISPALVAAGRGISRRLGDIPDSHS